MIVAVILHDCCSSTARLSRYYREAAAVVLSVCFRSNVSVISVRAPSPVTLQAVPKLSCRANIVSNNAVPASSKPRMAIISPKEASTVPPGTPGAPMAKKPSKMMNTIRVVKSGMLPYNICETVNTKNTSVNIEPHRWILANKGTVTSITS